MKMSLKDKILFTKIDSDMKGLQNYFSKIKNISNRRINNAKYLDLGLSDITNLTLPKRDKNITQVYHLYMFECDSRDKLKEFLNINGNFAIL